MRYADRSLDTVICNGVSMYFPSADYLTEVIRESLRALQPGGSFFLGDVRSLPLLPHFHASVQLYQAADELLIEELDAKVPTTLSPLLMAFNHVGQVVINVHAPGKGACGHSVRGTRPFHMVYYHKTT
jgi:SAM-dependent methyltransferase